MGARWILVPLTLVVAACEPPPDFVTRHGVAFHLGGSDFIAREHAEALEAELLAALDDALAPRDQTEACVGRTTVIVNAAGPFPCTADPSLTCAGEQQGALLTLAATDCPYASAYTHELLHWLQQCLHNVTDYAHEAPQWRIIHAQQSLAAERCGD